MASLKKSICEINHTSMGEMEAEPAQQNIEMKNGKADIVKSETVGPLFVNGVIVKIISSDPLQGRKYVKVIALSPFDLPPVSGECLIHYRRLRLVQS
ncbi:hypothetical protein FKM82_001398 [Ascaphus truei]